MYGVVVPALAAAVGFMRPSVVFAAGTPPPAVRPIFTVGVIVVLSVPPMVFVAIVYRPLTECVERTPCQYFFVFFYGGRDYRINHGTPRFLVGPPWERVGHQSRVDRAGEAPLRRNDTGAGPGKSWVQGCRWLGA